MNTSYAVILCGGSGSRLWPLSRTTHPKQLLKIGSDKTLLQETALRLSEHVEAENLLAVTHIDQKFEVKGQLADLFPRSAISVLAEPCARNTLPAIAWSVWQIYQRDPGAVIGVFPSDHAIENIPAFHQAWQQAESVANEGYFTLLGIQPTYPATGYGYIKPGKKLDHHSDILPISEVASFVEKPDLDRAVQFVSDGYFWNSGMFVFKAEVFLALLEKHQPDIANQLAHLDSETDITETYQNFPDLSIDYGLAEKAEKLAVVPVDMQWSDLGSWDAIFEKLPKDDANNVVHGDVISVDTKDSIIWSDLNLVTTLGVSNLAIIQTADALLICDRKRTEDIKPLVSLVQKKHPQLAAYHPTVQRPWGSYTVMEEGPNFKIKKICVKVGAKLSMQMHSHRSEHWVVVTGTARVTNGESVSELKANQSTYIPKQHRHRLENAGEVPLEIIEVQCGDYVGEDDIIRFEDTYGRSTQ